jgi:VanZ family protein
MYNHFNRQTLFIKPLIWLAFIGVLCLIPLEDLPNISIVNHIYFDKVVHFGMYFILAVLLAKPVNKLHLPLWPVILLTTVLIGGMIELLQFAITNYRSASWFDFFADLAGATAGLLSFNMMVVGKWWERYV